MKESTCSKSSSAARGKMSREDYLIKHIDRRSKSGENQTDNDFVNKHISDVNDDGERCWSF